jgi:hypothetical protein
LQEESALGALSKLSAASLGVFRGKDAVERGITRKRLAALGAQGVVERVHPDTHRMTSVPPSTEQQLRAVLLWAGDDAAATGRTAGELYGLEGVHAELPEIVVSRSTRASSALVVVHHGERGPLMVRQLRGVRVTGI